MSGLFDQITNYSPPLLTAGQVNYKGTWDAAANSPTLVSPPAATTKGDYYVVSVAGTQFTISFAVGDWIISNGTAWEKVDLTDAVSSVFGRTGAVVGASTDYSSVGLTNTAIGASSPSTGGFTTVTASSTIAATGAVTGSNLSGTNTGDQTITLTGGVTGSGTGSFAATVVTNANLTGAITSVGNATSLGSFTSANLAAALTDETGSGAAVFATSPTLVTPILGTPSSGTLSSCTGLPISTGVSGLGTGIATALAVNTGSAGAPVLFNGALGTPTSGTVTNLTGTASININGTVGATTRNTVAATTGNFQASGGAPIILTGNSSAQIQLGGTGATDPSIRYDAAGVLGVVTADQSAYAKIRALDFNGTVGATTPSTGAFTTLTASGAINSTQDSYNTFGSAAGQGLIRIGSASPSGDNVGWLVFNTSNSVYNWRIAANTITSGALDISASTVAGGSTFTTSIAKFSSTGLAVTGALSATGIASLTGTSPTLRIGNQASGGAGAILQLAPSSTQTNWLLGANQTVSGAFEITPSTAGGGTTFTTPAVVVNSSGNVGIGTTSPAAKLHISGTNAGIIFDRVSADVDPSGIQGSIYVKENGISNYEAMLFRATGYRWQSDAGTDRMLIDSSGNLLVGTTSTFSTWKLSVDSGSNDGIAGIANNVSSLPFIAWNKATSGDNVFAGFFTEGTITQRGGISYNRAAGLVVYGTTSDYRSKDILGPVVNSGALIDAVPVYMGKMKGATQERPMFIAHETPAYAHTGEKDAVDAEGKPIYQQIDTSALIPVLWAEIQSLRQRVAALEKSN